MSEIQSNEHIIDLTADIVGAYVSNNTIPANDLAGLVTEVYAAFREANESDKPKDAVELVPAVNPKKSVTDDYIICLEDGKKFKSLKRHIMTHYNLTPDQYREKWGLKSNYPMVAPSYAKSRSDLAKSMKLGQRN